MQVVSDPQAEHMGPWGWGLPFPWSQNKMQQLEKSSMGGERALVAFREGGQASPGTHGTCFSLVVGRHSESSKMPEGNYVL